MPAQGPADNSKTVLEVDSGLHSLNENENGLTEIESLCMNCHNDVRSGALR